MSGQYATAPQVVESHIDARGVLHREYIEPAGGEKPAAKLPTGVHTDPPPPAQTPRRRAMPPARRPGGRQVTVHTPVEDPDAPGCCLHCHRPIACATDAHGPLPTVPEQADARRAVDPGDD